MSNRDLASVAVIVWGIAVLLGVFVGALLLLGMQVDVGLIINALAAMGAFSAAVAAVWVATGDRRDRPREAEDAATAQARLVVLTKMQMYAGREAEGAPLAPRFQIQVDNYSESAILDVTLEAAQFQRPDGSWVQASWLDHATMPVVVPRRETQADQFGRTEFGWPGIVFLDEHRHQVFREVDRRWPQVNLDRIVATITFTDAHGQRWKRAGDRLVERL